MVKTAEPPTYTSAPIDQLAATVNSAAQSGGSKIITGTVLADPVDGWVDVDRGGGEIIPAMDRGLLDAAEFNNASSDRQLGFPDVSKVCMLQSYHQNAEQFEILFNGTKYNALSPKLRAILDNCVEAASADMSWKAIDRYSKAYDEMQKTQGVKFYKTPDSILRNQLKVFDEVVAKKSAENPLFKKIVDSQRAFAQRAVKWDLDTNVSRRMAFDHYFPSGAKKA